MLPDYRKSNWYSNPPLYKNNTEPDHFYVTKQTNIQQFATRAFELLNGQYKSIYIHGMGAAINRALVLAMEVQNRFGGCATADITTSTETCENGLLPCVDGPPYTANETHDVSAVHVCISIPDLKNEQV